MCLIATRSLASSKQSMTANSRVDILVDNTGREERRSILGSTREDIDRVMAVNFGGMVNCTLAVIPGMVEQSSETSDHEHVVRVPLTLAFIQRAPIFRAREIASGSPRVHGGPCPGSTTEDVTSESASSEPSAVSLFSFEPLVWTWG